MTKASFKQLVHDHSIVFLVVALLLKWVLNLPNVNTTLLKWYRRQRS